ncbi:unannotated protein [freshwater metagenome]|uniref:Unannotated protein n=1 Tax=freshwater metagenome TaxID=449393 RepID=A0A6J7IF71_9ZZZZ
MVSPRIATLLSEREPPVSLYRNASRHSYDARLRGRPVNLGIGRSSRT